MVLSVCLANRKPLAAIHLSDFQHQNILKKMCNVIEQHGFSKLVTGAMKMSISELLSHCLEALSFTSPQEGEAKHIKDLVFSVLLAAVGKNIESSVCTSLLLKTYNEIKTNKFRAPDHELRTDFSQIQDF